MSGNRCKVLTFYFFGVEVAPALLGATSCTFLCFFLRQAEDKKTGNAEEKQGNHDTGAGLHPLMFVSEPVHKNFQYAEIQNVCTALRCKVADSRTDETALMPECKISIGNKSGDTDRCKEQADAVFRRKPHMAKPQIRKISGDIRQHADQAVAQQLTKERGGTELM